MLSTDIPSVFNIPWADGATAPYIHAVPEASQIGITPGAASLTDGFPPLNFLSYLAGGIPPFGNDFNGILNQVTAWLRWNQAGGLPRYNAAFQTAIGGYPSGAVLVNATSNWLWVSTADSNVTNPDTGGAGWSPLTPRYQAAGVPTGAINGANQTYTLPQSPVGSIAVVINGLIATATVDYTLSGVTITHLGTALSGTDTITFLEYRY